MIVDTHVHYGGAPGRHEHPVDELLALAKSAGTDRIVQVTLPSGAAGKVPTAVWDETNRLSIEQAASRPDGVAKVIVHFDAAATDAIVQMERYAAYPNVVGFRVNSGNLATFPPILKETSTHELLASAERLGMVVQLWAPYQSREMLDIARRFPKLRIWVDHMGLRFGENADNSGIFREWPQLIQLASQPNVWVKVSYFPEAGRAFDTYPFPSAQRYFKELYEKAGPTRLMWGSNYPPSEKVCTYRQALDFVREHCTFLSAADRDGILGGNFMRDFGK